MTTTNLSSLARRTATAVGVAVLTTILISGCGSGPASPTSSAAKLDPATTVSTKLLSFEPAKLTVKVGTKVTWTDLDTIAHTVTTGTFTLGSDGLRTAQNPDGLIDLPLRAGKNLTFTFTKPGKYVYYCSIHHGMNGEIDVTE